VGGERRIMISKIFFPISCAMAIFYLLWCVIYPRELWESLTFRNDDGLRGHFVSVLTILFMIGFINAIYYISKLFLNS